MYEVGGGGKLDVSAVVIGVVVNPTRIVVFPVFELNAIDPATRPRTASPIAMNMTLEEIAFFKKLWFFILFQARV